MRRYLTRLLVIFMLVVVAGLGAAGWWLFQPLALKSSVLDFEVELGQSPHAVAQGLADAGVEVQPSLLYWWFKLSGSARKIKAGSYEITPGASPYTLLQMLTRGAETLRAVVLVEGWNLRQLREALAREDGLRHDSAELSEAELMQRLGQPGVAAEGRFFPDTYNYAKGSSELELLRRAQRAMQRKLDAAWAARASDLAITTPEQALILASLIEKETGRASDRSLVSAVFQNRLRAGMMLQTDPSVIYGLGTHYDGSLHRRDLLADTPWNTYTRNGLPPTPIAMPGYAALLAAVQPAHSRALYFVARGDGSSEFSDDLEAHNKAVNRFIRGKSTPP